jgi:hypothetical protein
VNDEPEVHYAVSGDLVAGSGISFDDRGEHVLRGIPTAWHLFAVST